MSNKTNGTGISKRASLECGIGAFRIGPALGERTILNGDRIGNRIAVPVSPSLHVAKPRFARMSLTVISPETFDTVFGGIDSL